MQRPILKGLRFGVEAFSQDVLDPRVVEEGEQSCVSEEGECDLEDVGKWERKTPL